MRPRRHDLGAPASPDSGFTLLEVLAAVAIAGVLLSAIGAVVSVTMAGLRSAPDRVALAAAGHTLLDTLPEGEALRPGSTSGMLGAVSYAIVVTPAPGLGPPPSGRDNGPPRPGWVPATVTIDARTPSGRTLRLATVRLLRAARP